MTRRPIAKLRADVVKAAMRYFPQMSLDIMALKTKRKLHKACAALAEREKGK